MKGYMGPDSEEGRHFSCSMTAVLLARVEAWGGPDAVAELLRISDVGVSEEELRDTGNWISCRQAEALWRAGGEVTHHPQFARAVGEDSVSRLGSSPVATLLRSLGSTGKVFEHLAMGSKRFSTTVDLSVVELDSGRAVVDAVSIEGFSRSAAHCGWTWGLLSRPPTLFGLAPAHVEHEECAALGAERCRYVVTWDERAPRAEADRSDAVLALRTQLTAMRERMHGMFATATDLIGGDDLEVVLSRITDRAAVEVRAPRYLLSVRLPGDAEAQHYAKGLDPAGAAEVAARLESVAAGGDPLPPSWLVAPVRSDRHDYGCVVALFDADQQFFPQERDLLEVYARYAALALDGATALSHVRRIHGQSRALLELSRALAASGTSREVAARLAAAVPGVVDCDGVDVYLWEADRQALVHGACLRAGELIPTRSDWTCTPQTCPPLLGLLADPTTGPTRIEGGCDPHGLAGTFAAPDASATVVMPIGGDGVLLGLFTVCVDTDGRFGRLRLQPELVDALSAVAAQASTALQNGRLVDTITHQALHDALTGLANRARFGDELREAVGQVGDEEEVALIYIDLDGFKPINDEFGHDVGDALLVAVGERLRGCTRAGDVVARLGGDEFTILVDDQGGPANRHALIARLHEAFARPFLIDGHTLRIGASVGSAVFPDDADTPEELLQVADRAMFSVKRSR